MYIYICRQISCFVSITQTSLSMQVYYIKNIFHAFAVPFRLLKYRKEIIYHRQKRRNPTFPCIAVVVDFITVLFSVFVFLFFVFCFFFLLLCVVVQLSHKCCIADNLIDANIAGQLFFLFRLFHFLHAYQNKYYVQYIHCTYKTNTIQYTYCTTFSRFYIQPLLADDYFQIKHVFLYCL